LEFRAISYIWKATTATVSDKIVAL